MLVQNGRLYLKQNTKIRSAVLIFISKEANQVGLERFRNSGRKKKKTQSIQFCFLWISLIRNSLNCCRLFPLSAPHLLCCFRIRRAIIFKRLERRVKIGIFPFLAPRLFNVKGERTWMGLRCFGHLIWTVLELSAREGRRELSSAIGFCTVSWRRNCNY